MKILFFATYYDPYLSSFYQKNPDLSAKPYREQLDCLISDFFGAFGSYTLECRTQGHEAELIIANCEPLQRQWAKEQKIFFDERNWRFSIPIEQCKVFRPDIFFIGSMFEYYGDFLAEIQSYAKSIFGWISCPMPSGIFHKSHPRLILSSSPHYVDQFRQSGLKSELLPAFFDNRILDAVAREREKDKRADTIYDFTFVGGVTRAHKSRAAAIKKLAKKTSIKLFGYGYEGAFHFSRRFRPAIFPNYVQRAYLGESWGLEMYRVLKNSLITFNSHGEIAEGYGVNMRMYEATGSGALLLTDGKGRNQLFNDNEVVYYENINEAIEKVNYFLANPAARIQIAAAGQKRTLSEYNAPNTVHQMLSFFQEYL